VHRPHRSGSPRRRTHRQAARRRYHSDRDRLPASARKPRSDRCGRYASREAERGTRQPPSGPARSAPPSWRCRSRTIPGVGSPAGNQRRHLGRLRVRHAANPTHPGSRPA
jgi:hypothetical protein